MRAGNNGAGCGEFEDEAIISAKFSSGGCKDHGKRSSGASEKQTDTGVSDFRYIYDCHDRWNYFCWHGWDSKWLWFLEVDSAFYGCALYQ